MLKKSEYISLMQHAIGGGTPATGHDLDQTFQRAGRALFGKKSWPWLMQGPISLAASAGSPEIALPADFQELVSITETTNPLAPVHLTNAVEVMHRRVLPIRGYGYQVALTGWDGQATPGVSVTPRMLLDRTPTQDGTPTFSMMYRRGWTEVVDDDAVPNMPAYMENALVYLCRSMAWAMENDDEHPDAARAEKEIADQWDQYGRAQRVLGQIRGGAGDRPMRSGASVRSLPPGLVLP